MLKKVYYYNFQEIYENFTFQILDCKQFLKNIFNEETLAGLMVPSNLDSESSIYNDLLSLVISRYRNYAVVKIVKRVDEEAPSHEEINTAFHEWAYRFLSLLNATHEYYITLLSLYNNAKSDLMADIKATSKNKVKFNDTPQNANTSDVYEGDDYITHFTATEGENSSPLMSKMMRLKEIQDNYRNLMSDWVKDFQKIFYQEEC